MPSHPAGLFEAFASAEPGEIYTVTVNDGSTTRDATVTVAAAAPTDFVADGSYGGPLDIRLTWRDNATGESGFEIWDKEGSGAFVLIDTAAAGAGAGSEATQSPTTEATAFPQIALRSAVSLSTSAL